MNNSKSSKVFIVVLRRPRNSGDQRNDPFWEFGSFGLTGCHGHNLMHSNKLSDSRLAFAQGYKNEYRLVHLTSPIKVHTHKSKVELKWVKSEKPFKYEHAPKLIANSEDTEFIELCNSIRNGNCKSSIQNFSSKFRSRNTPLEPKLANEIIRIFEKRYNRSTPKMLAGKYSETIPGNKKIDKNRKQTYEKYLREANSTSKKSRVCTKCYATHGKNQFYSGYMKCNTIKYENGKKAKRRKLTPQILKKKAG